MLSVTLISVIEEIAAKSSRPIQKGVIGPLKEMAAFVAVLLKLQQDGKSENAHH